jgi:hypothetical protein
MNLHLAWQTFTVRGGPHEYLRELVGSSAFHLHQNVLLNDICQFLLLLFALVHFLLQVSDLLAKDIEPMAICRSVCYGTDESRVGVFEGLAKNKQRDDRGCIDEPYPPSYQQAGLVSGS